MEAWLIVVPVVVFAALVVIVKKASKTDATQHNRTV